MNQEAIDILSWSADRMQTLLQDTEMRFSLVLDDDDARVMTTRAAISFMVAVLATSDISPKEAGDMIAKLLRAARRMRPNGVTWRK